MIFQRINKEGAEKVFSLFQNVAGATITAGYPAVLDVTAPNGSRVSKPATATLGLFVGVAAKDIADSAFGLFQQYGYRASAFVTNDTAVAITAGNPLKCVAGQWHMADGGGVGDGKSGFVYACEAVAVVTTAALGAANKKVFIRAL